MSPFWWTAQLGNTVRAKNTGEGFRRGSVDNRTQVKAPNGNYVKRDAGTGRFMDQKSGGKPFKGVAREKDGRRG